MFDRLLLRLKEVWANMSLNQKVITGAIISALLLTAIYISTLSNLLLEYTVLSGQLDPKSASEIIERLEQQKIPYHLTQGGTAIEVPADQADKLKIDLAADGLPESGIIGYEILDTTNLGMSNFLQKVNYRRALEGELRRTLRRFEDVEDASVNLVIPEPSLFTEEAETPSAAVVLQLKRGRTLPPSSVTAIANLISSAAVEGLSPQNVTILDTRGTQLSKPVMDELAMQSSTLLDVKFTFEKRLAQKVKLILDGALGPGMSIVAVNAELNFDQIERQSTLYNQENSGILSEERIEVTAPDEEGGGEETTTTNYEVGRIVENMITSPGSKLERLTVSVMLDDGTITQQTEEGATEVERIPWTQEQLANIRAISEAAVGFDQARGDRLEIMNITFGARGAEDISKGLTVKEGIVESIRAAVLGIAILAAIGVFFAIVRSIIHTLDPSRIKIAADEEFKKQLPQESIDDKTLVSERTDIIKRIVSKSVNEPEISAKTLRSLYRED